MDFTKHISQIEKKIGYTFKDKSLLMQAFTRSSFCNENRGVKGREFISNEILEFFGDSVLSTAIISMMLRDKTERYEHGVYTRLKEGDFSNIRSKLSDKRNLSKSMAALGLQKYLLMGDGDAKLGIENEPSGSAALSPTAPPPTSRSCPSRSWILTATERCLIPPRVSTTRSTTARTSST